MSLHRGVWFSLLVPHSDIPATLRSSVLINLTISRNCESLDPRSLSMADLTVVEVFRGPGVNNFTLSAKSDQIKHDAFGATV